MNAGRMQNKVSLRRGEVAGSEAVDYREMEGSRADTQTEAEEDESVGGLIPAAKGRLGPVWAAALAALLGFSACSPGEKPGQEEGASAPRSETERMAKRLEIIAESADPQKNAYIGDRRVSLFESMLEQAKDPKRRLSLQRRRAEALLNAGRSEEAITAFQELKRSFEAYDPALLEEMRKPLLEALAISYLRLGEQQNCLENHTIDSCLFPIQDGGVHELTHGSERASEILIDLLERYPDSLEGRWLLNLAAMTLGEYPDGVPDRWRIEPEVFESDAELPRFYDVAGPLGLDVHGLAGGVVLEDLTGNGYLDLMVSSWGLRDPLRFFVNRGDGAFVERTEEAGLSGMVSGLNLIHGDYNNDGHPDVFVMRGAWLGAAGRHPNSLLRNNGNGTFTDVTESSGLLSFYPTQTATWLDYNLDGHLDLFIGNESFRAQEYPCELYRNNGDGTFTEVGQETGVDWVAPVKGVVAGDFNNDDYPDLYLSCLGAPNVLLRNEGAEAGGPSRGFTDVADQAGVAEPTHSFPVWFWDYNNDGWRDLFVAGYQVGRVGQIAADYLGLPHEGEKARLYRNDGDGTFSDVTAEADLDRVIYAMGVNYGDLDNDGGLDFYAGTGDPDLTTLVPNRMFLNRPHQDHFEEVTSSGRFGHLQKGHGVAFGDIDQDGDQDLYAVIGGAYSGDPYWNVLFKNPGSTDHHWLKLRLVGRQTNRSAIGARIEVVLDTGDGVRTLHRTVGTGGSFGSNPLLAEIGLGQAEAVREVVVHWPVGGTTQRFHGLEVDRAYRIREGQEPTPMTLEPFSLPEAQGTVDHMHHRRN